MANFDELFKMVSDGVAKAGEAAKVVANKTVSKVETMTREAKIRYAIHEAEDRMNQNYTQIGEIVYNSYRTGQKQDFTEYLGRLDALYDEIQGLQDQLKEECNLHVCPDCDTLVKRGDSYCPKCGAKMRDEYI